MQKDLVDRYLLDIPKATDIVSYYSEYNRIYGATRKYRRFFMSSPNANWCPGIGTLKCPVSVRYDGTFGWDDPVCWPQNHDADAPHLPCIPVFDPDPRSPVYLFRRGLTKDQVDLTELLEDNLRTGRIRGDLILELELAISRMTNRARTFISTDGKHHPRLDSLTKSLRLAVDRISTSVAPLRELRMGFGLAARFYLECEGYFDYYTKYLPRLTVTDRPTVDNNVIGVLTTDEGVCTEYLRMGVPVWLIRCSPPFPRIPDQDNRHAQRRIYQQRPRLPGDCFRDDGYVRGPSVFPEPQSDTKVLMRAIDSWARERLEDE